MPSLYSGLPSPSPAFRILALIGVAGSVLFLNPGRAEATYTYNWSFTDNYFGNNETFSGTISGLNDGYNNAALGLAITLDSVTGPYPPFSSLTDFTYLDSWDHTGAEFYVDPTSHLIKIADARFQSFNTGIIIGFGTSGLNTLGTDGKTT